MIGMILLVVHYNQTDKLIINMGIIKYRLFILAMATLEKIIPKVKIIFCHRNPTKRDLENNIPPALRSSLQHHVLCDLCSIDHKDDNVFVEWSIPPEKTDIINVLFSKSTSPIRVSYHELFMYINDLQNKRDTENRIILARQKKTETVEEIPDWRNYVNTTSAQSGSLLKSPKKGGHLAKVVNPFTHAKFERLPG